MKKMIIYVATILLTILFVLSLFPLERKEANKWETQTIKLERVFQQEVSINEPNSYDEYVEYSEMFYEWLQENGCSRQDCIEHNKNYLNVLDKKGVEY